MTYQILNGDSLATHFADAKIDGEVIVMRECLIEGNVQGKTMIDFFLARAEYLSETHHTTVSNYFTRVVNEIDKITRAGTGSEFNLWFEYDLFCQVNMWFLLSMIDALTIQKKVFAVYSSHLDQDDKNFWGGFGSATAANLNTSYRDKIAFDSSCIRHGADLWTAYKNADFPLLKTLSKNTTEFPHTEEVAEAHAARFPSKGKKGRPEKALEEIMKKNDKDFNTVYGEFNRGQSIYGFGDTQVKWMYDKIRSEQA